MSRSRAHRLWRHEHRFEDVPGGTKVIDHVDYRSPGGPLEPLITGLLVRRDVEQIFAWRRKVLAEIFAAPVTDAPAGKAAATG